MIRFAPDVPVAAASGSLQCVCVRGCSLNGCCLIDNSNMMIQLEIGWCDNGGSTTKWALIMGTLY